MFEFEWDPAKSASNRTKHEVSFDEAATVFDDPQGLDGPDLAHSMHERRRRRIGRSSVDAVLLVVYTVRSPTRGEEKTIRIISARRANRTERSAYLALAEEN